MPTLATHIHSSSRFDRSPESLAGASLVYQSDAELITYTEVNLPDRKQALRQAARGRMKTLTGSEGHADDCAIQYDSSIFELLYHESFQNSTRVVHTTSGHARDLPYSRIAVFKDVPADRVFVMSVSHYASDVQDQIRNLRTTYGRVLQWRESTRKSKRRVNHLAKKYNADARLIIADWNVDFKQRWVRVLIKALAPRYRSAWTITDVAGGTHGNHSILDATIMRGKIKVRGSAQLYKDDASSDHRPYIEVLTWQ